MSKKIVARRAHRKVCVGDLNTVIQIHNRNIMPPVFGATDYTEEFSGTKEAWALVRTSTGQSIFSDVNLDVSISHVIYIRYDETVTSESWVELPGRMLLDIVGLENLEERSEFMRLSCSARGSKDAEAAKT